jgi:adhesin/invasin
VALYCTGLGVVSNPPATGAQALNNPLSEMPVLPTVSGGAVQVGAIFGGLAPGFVGLSQVNFVVPPNALGGTVNITVTLNGVTSAPTPFAVAP